MAQHRLPDEGAPHELDELIERLVHATKPDPVCDTAIKLYLYRGSKSVLDHPIGTPPFTSSIEVALWVVPDGWGWQLDHSGICKVTWLADGGIRSFQSRG